ncbi:MAG: lysylphosphatidylglycerol synthase transmembrane domain-containing protein [Acidimicrobiales bacterium]
MSTVHLHPLPGSQPRDPADRPCSPTAEAEHRHLGAVTPPRRRSALVARGLAAWRWARRGLAVGLLGAGLFALYDERRQVSRAASLLTDLNWPWVAAGAGAEIASMVVFARLQRFLLRAGGADIGLGSMVEITLAGNALSVSVPGGAVWSASFTFEQLRRRGADRALAVWVLLSAGALASFGLFLLLATGVWIAGPVGPAADFRLPALGLASIPLVVATIALATRHSRTVHRAGSALLAAAEHRLPHGGQAATALGSLTVRLRAVQPGAGDWLGGLSLALLNWAFDATCLAACLAALGVHVPWRGLLVAYGLAQVGASLPVTPGGLGVVEGSLSFALMAYGVDAGQAVAVVLLYRILSFWALVPIGWGAWGRLEIEARRQDRAGRDRVGPRRNWAWFQGRPAPTSR